MASNFETVLSGIDTYYYLAEVYNISASSYWNAAHTHYNAGQYNECLWDLLLAVNKNIKSIDFLIGSFATGHSHSDYAVPLLFHLLLDDEYAPDIVLRWKMICEAWVKDDFEGRVWTIGIIDRMRQILWDEPFNMTWAARPEETKP